MPVTPSYPGVYVEEVPSQARSIGGVSTSLTAFVGAALRGPTNSPTIVSSYGEFERAFGGLWASSPMTYAVQQYFQNGGSQAMIVRVAGDGSASAASAAQTVTQGVRFTHADKTLSAVIAAPSAGTYDITFTADGEPLSAIAVADDNSTLASLLSTVDGGKVTMTGTAGSSAALPAGTYNEGSNSIGVDSVAGTETVTLTAVSSGAWGNQLRFSVDVATGASSVSDGFNLTVEEVDGNGNVVRSEVHRNLTLHTTRNIVTVLAEASSLVHATISGTVAAGERMPVVSDVTLTSGADGTYSDDELLGSEGGHTGIYALAKAAIFNMLCLPPAQFDTPVSAATWAAALTFCENNRAFAIVDGDPSWSAGNAAAKYSTLGLNSKNGAMYWPWVRVADPLDEGRLADFAPCGVVAGAIARNDASRGVWKAPAGLEVTLRPARDLTETLTDAEQGAINPSGLNVLRSLPGAGRVVWGSRTLVGSDRLASEWKYVPVRRLALMIEEALYRGTQWVVFEPNDEPLWSQIRLSIGAYMHGLFRQGAFQGTSASQAYFVKCDSETTTQADIDAGVVNILVGFAPLKPAEFVILRIQQIAPGA